MQLLIEDFCLRPWALTLGLTHWWNVPCFCCVFVDGGGGVGVIQGFGFQQVGGAFLRVPYCAYTGFITCAQ